MAENTLPRISEATRERIKSYGFTNHLYDYLQLPSVFTPRAPGFNTYTYVSMAIAAAGGMLASRYGFTRMPFGVAFVCAPLFAFYQKKEADFNLTSELSRRHPQTFLQFYPDLNLAFRQVNAEVDSDISKHEEIVRALEQRVNRKE